MSLVDDFFKGVQFGTNWVRSGEDQRDAVAARRIALDAAQMQLEDDLMTREARLNNAIATLDNQGHLANQQQRFRQALENQQFLADQSGLAASTSQNYTTLQANEQARAIGNATFPYRATTAVNNAQTDVINSGTGIVNANTNSIFAGAQYGATKQNAGNIQQTYSTQYQTSATLADTGFINAQQQQEAIIRMQQDFNEREAMMKAAVTAAGSTDRAALIATLETMANDMQNSPERQIMARDMAETLKAGGDQQKAVNPMVREIEVNPEAVARQVLGVRIVGQADNGDLILLDTDGNRYGMTRSGLQAMIARSLGLDAKAYEERDKIDANSRAKALHGDNVAASLGLGAGPGQVRLTTPEHVNNELFYRLQRNYMLGQDGNWYNRATGQVLTPEEYQALRNELARREGVTLEPAPQPNQPEGARAPTISEGNYYGGW